MSLFDLEEMALRCRDDAARSYIREAVACYKAAAFRSCIVATWNAVVFDFLHKLRELELSGDKNATHHLKEYEVIRSAGRPMLSEAQKFEEDVLNLAQNTFELLTPLERSDLNRLREDRHRCAHPSMQSVDEPYAPSAELARVHLRSAVEILLSREPVQGKSAITRVFDDIKSYYFPRDVAHARIVLEAGPLKRARRSLVRDVFVGLSKDLLREQRSGSERGRQFAALGALIEIHGAIVSDLLPKDLPSLLGSVKEEELWKALAYCRRVAGAWEASGKAVHTKLGLFIAKATGSSLRRGIAHALHIPELRDHALARIGDLSDSELATVVSREPRREYTSDVLRRLNEATSFNMAEVLAENTLMPLVGLLKPDDIAALVQVTIDNSQMRKAWGIPGIIERVFEGTAAHIAQSRSHWQLLRDSLKNSAEWENYSSLDAKMTLAGV